MFLVAAIQPPPRQHLKYEFSKIDASKKKTVRNAIVTRS
jgi:hypothetical protein